MEKSPSNNEKLHTYPDPMPEVAANSITLRRVSGKLLPHRLKLAAERSISSSNHVNKPFQRHERLEQIVALASTKV